MIETLDRVPPYAHGDADAMLDVMLGAAPTPEVVVSAGRAAIENTGDDADEPFANA